MNGLEARRPSLTLISRQRQFLILRSGMNEDKGPLSADWEFVGFWVKQEYLEALKEGNLILPIRNTLGQISVVGLKAHPKQASTLIVTH